MKLYTSKAETAAASVVVVDDMILTKEMPTAAGSKMLEGYRSLFDAEVITRLHAAGYAIGGKAAVGEFAIDLVGETAYDGACVADGILRNAAAEIIKAGEAKAVVGLDVNGSVRRAAAQNGLISVKPTYGTVSRYGTVPVACSGETVSVMAKTAADCREILEAIAGHDDKDGTSLSEECCAQIKSGGSIAKPAKVAVITGCNLTPDAEAAAKLSAFGAMLEQNGISVTAVDAGVLTTASAAWNILMSAELCNNVSRYDGIKYGYRTENFENIDELYTNSRTEAFGALLKTAILYGSDALSSENYMKVYDKALRIRRVIADAFAALFAQYDAVLMPACSKMVYTEADVQADRYISFAENCYTAPASITGLPVVVAGGVQMIGKAFAEPMLFAMAELYEKEGK